MCNIFPFFFSFFSFLFFFFFLFFFNVPYITLKSFYCVLEKKRKEASAAFEKLPWPHLFVVLFCRERYC